ncbi:MAG: hypothetical protein J3K34DRAFT_396173 [Monoraphidium minutum]|nr:MAG: hypothetical protein J3K34DRAFT_396173 [Monoraphidium minutum]
MAQCTRVSQSAAAPQPGHVVLGSTRPIANAGERRGMHPASQRGGGPTTAGGAIDERQGHWCDPAPLDMYCEPQRHGFCGAHAVNAALGELVVTGEDMVAYLECRWGHMENVEYNSNGWFSLAAINFWLYEHTPPSLAVSFYPVSMLSDAPGGALTGLEVRAVLETGGYEQALINTGQRHWVAAARSPLDRQWYLLDSIPFSGTGKVKRMTNQDWEDGFRPNRGHEWIVNVLAPIAGPEWMTGIAAASTRPTVAPDAHAVAAATVRRAIREVEAAGGHAPGRDCAAPSPPEATVGEAAPPGLPWGSHKERSARSPKRTRGPNKLLT